MEKPPLLLLLDVFPEKRYISLLEVLSTVDRFSHFLDGFEHWQGRYARPKPPDRTFYAGILGFGCFIGLPKMATISTRISESELENVVNWYFSLETIQAANDHILQFMDQLELPEVYRRQPGKLHTSSDGQKFEVSVESLMATYSYKYFGQNQGVSAYNFLDERHFGFHSNVVSASEGEAHYVIDGLMHNDVVKSDLHSTDTDGYTVMWTTPDWNKGNSAQPANICIPQMEGEFHIILRYVDEVGFRQAIEKQMNKIENANKFSCAIAFGNNQSFLYGDKIEQEMAEGCRRLIKNAIICWNYLYLTQKIAEAENEERRHELLEAVKNGSVAAWQHVNLHGEYDFSDEKPQDSVGLYLPPELDIFGLHTEADAELGVATH